MSRNIGSAWRIPRQASCRQWVPDNVVIPSETETPGLFDLDKFPHVAGILEAVDDPMIHEIYLPWAARNAKTTTGISVLMYQAVNKPRPMIFASSNEERTNDAIDSQVYPMLEACPATRDLLPPKHRRTKKTISLKRCRIRRAFSGSPSTLAGYPACYYLASELSKWTKTKSNEADAIRLIGQRAKLYPMDKVGIYESTPALKGECNISSLHNKPSTDRRRREVPCPHCGTYQALEFGDKDPDSPGIKWEKDENGNSSPLLAEKTAYYQCVRGCRIEDYHRPEMMRKGLWVSEGQSVNEYGEIVGDRAVDSSTVSFGPLSSLYSLVISGWGQVAREFLDSCGDQEALRDFWNSTLALEWDPKPQTVEPNILSERLCIGERFGIVPSWARFLTGGIDTQEDGGTFVFNVSAWGQGGRGQSIWHGECRSFPVLKSEVLEKQYPHADGGEPMRISFSLLDSGGFESESIYRLLRSEPRILPCKGSSTKMDLEYKLSTLTAEKRRNKLASGDVQLMLVDTEMTNKWIQRHIDGKARPDEPAYYLSCDDAFDLEFLEELLNEMRIREADKYGNIRVKWVRRNPYKPNDKRDAIRYAKAAASYMTDGGKRWDRLPQRKDPDPKVNRSRKRHVAEPFAARDEEGFSAR